MSDAQFIAEQVCPFLGLPDDPASHYSFADLGHRCHARAKVVPIELTYQASYCLGAQYEMCSRYKAATRNIALSAPVPGPGPAAGPAPAPQATRHRSRSRPAVLALLTLALAATALVVIAANGLASPSPAAPPSTQVMALAETASAPPAPSPSPTASPTPTPTLASTPTVRPTPTFAPTQRPAPSPLIHIVQRGETLSEIASLYGVRAREIAEANGLENKAKIYIGQELVIPTQ